MSGRLFTIGHSNHEMGRFLELLRRHRIATLVDVRSDPSSQYAAHFDSLVLKAAVEAVGVRYVFMGYELGGRPPGDEFYDDEGYVLYSRVAHRPEFVAGIQRLGREWRAGRVVIMCSEENPAECHRRLLIGRVLSERGVGIDHLRGDGRLQTEEELTAEQQRGDGQLSLFLEPEGAAEWKSTRSVLPKRRPRSSFRY